MVRPGDLPFPSDGGNLTRLRSDQMHILSSYATAAVASIQMYLDLHANPRAAETNNDSDNDNDNEDLAQLSAC